MKEFKPWDNIIDQFKNRNFTVISTKGERIMAVDENGLVKFLWKDDVELDEDWEL